MCRALAFFIVIVHWFCVDANNVDYFVDLINNEREKALGYKLPENAKGYFSPPNQLFYGEFDYVIVGAGTAGSVIANRLSENEDWKILLIEAGNYENNFTDIPAMRYATELSDYNWGFKSTPQKYSCLGMVETTCLISRGRGVGGTTLINGLVYTRPNPHDFKRWENQGNPGWSYEEVLPYFKKSENINIPDADNGYHGNRGYLSVEHRKPQSPHLKAFLEANVELGKNIVDYNGKYQMGASQVQHNTYYGVRQSTGKAFLKPVIHRKNLWVSTKSHVTKILIDEDSCAQGVEFSYNHKRYAAFATREVVLAAGAVGSPQLLQLSGVGPKKLLEKHAINVIADLGVGENLSDHPTFLGLYFDTTHPEPVRDLRSYVKEYLQGFGPLTQPGNNQGVGFYRTPLAHFPSPDLQITIITANSSSEFTPKVQNLQKDTVEALFDDSDPTREFSLRTTLLQPVSKGTVFIKSKDPFEYPIIDLNLLSNEHDLESLYKSIEVAFDLVDTNPFRHMSARYSPRPLPACDEYVFLTKDYWYCAIKQLTMGQGNLGGSCRMGANKNDSVVDHQFRVHGVKNLRLADASVFPFPLSSDYTAAVVLVAERASDFIKKEQNEKGTKQNIVIW